MAEPDTDCAALRAHVERGLAIVEQRLAAVPDAPNLASIHAQLLFIRDALDAGRTPSETEKDRIILGVIAAREYDTSDPDFADALFNVDYLFKRL